MTRADTIARLAALRDAISESFDVFHNLIITLTGDEDSAWPSDQLAYQVRGSLAAVIDQLSGRI